MWKPLTGRVCIIKETGELGLILGRMMDYGDSQNLWLIKVENNMYRGRWHHVDSFIVIGWLG